MSVLPDPTIVKPSGETEEVAKVNVVVAIPLIVVVAKNPLSTLPFHER